MNKKLFITGIPTAGKSFLGRKLASESGGIFVELDEWRGLFANDERYKDHIHFYLNQDEYTYYTTKTPEERWQDLVRQSEGLWPGILEKMQEYEKEEHPIIFEGVNLLPHLTKKDLSFPGVVIIGTSYEQTLERNIREPRWGSTKELQELEAGEFFNDERPRYKAEAEKYGYSVFETGDAAYQEAYKLLNG